MTSWSKLKDISCIHPCNETLKNGDYKVESYFLEVVSGFLKDNCAKNCYRPIPPMLGNGKSVDLLILYFVVKKGGGFEAICSNNCWDEVGFQCGFGSGQGSALKLVYVKYLSSLESWLMKVAEGSNWESKVLMDIERDFKLFLSVDGRRKNGGDGYCSYNFAMKDVAFVDLMGDDDDDDGESEGKKLDWKTTVKGFVEFEEENVEMSSADAGDLTDGIEKAVKLMPEDAEDSTEGNDWTVKVKTEKFVKGSMHVEGFMEENVKREKSEKSSADDISSYGSDKRSLVVMGLMADNLVKSSGNSVTSKKFSGEEENSRMNVDSQVSNNKRKRDSLSGMLHWMANVAKDPTDPVIGVIPECSRLKFHGNDKYWKQALLARDALFLKKIRVQSADLSGCQKKQKLHPSIFGDQMGNKQRFSSRLLFDNFPTPSKVDVSSISSSHQSDAYPLRPRLEARLDLQPTASIYTGRPQQRIPVGKAFQAEVPEWTGVAVESDSKWLGKRVWPLDKTENRNVIEREPMGKGRVDGCGCEIRGSTDCVKFHVTERRMKLRFELGSAFYVWGFNKMGEQFILSWTINEQKKFRNVIRENPSTLQKSLWDSMRKAFPHRSRADMVNYFFNVFMLQRRAYQNRHYPSEIDSDDDETEYRSTCNSLRHGAV